MSDFKLGPNQEKWLAALESGEWKQCDEQLHKPGVGYCCLGVANAIFHFGLPDENGCFDEFQASELGMWSTEGELFECDYVKVESQMGCGEGTGFGTSLIDFNDSGATFAEIAAFIRANPELVFKESK